MQVLTFKGGIDVPHNKKFTESKPIIDYFNPKKVYLSLRQHIGAPAVPLVKRGELVKRGQIIAEAGGFVSQNIHSSVSGKVLGIKEMDILGISTTIIEIENDFLDELDEDVKPKTNIETLTSEELLDLLKSSGIVGMGGAGFPTHVKFSIPPDKQIDTLIINAAECEPYLTTDHRIMLEYPEEFIKGVELFKRILKPKNVFIGVETNKLDAIKKLKKVCPNDINIIKLKTKYPQGAEKQLIYAATKREVPSKGLPLDVGCVVTNVSTAKAFYDYIYTGLPLVDRICTITGNAINTPSNVKIRIGTLISDIINFCGGYKEGFSKLILGGPMMGNSSSSLEIPSSKLTGGLLLLDENKSDGPEILNCIRCSKCVDICPINLEPIYISKFSLLKEWEIVNNFNPLDCIECGSCSFICPSHRPLLHSIRVAKRAIIERSK